MWALTTLSFRTRALNTGRQVWQEKPREPSFRIGSLEWNQCYLERMLASIEALLPLLVASHSVHGQRCGKNKTHNGKPGYCSKKCRDAKVCAHWVPK
eukprot:2726030-Amphidinium_carterae.1